MSPSLPPATFPISSQLPDCQGPSSHPTLRQAAYLWLRPVVLALLGPCPVLGVGIRDPSSSYRCMLGWVGPGSLRFCFS